MGHRLEERAKYRFSFYARCASGFKGEFDARLESTTGKVYATAKLKGIGADWKRFETVLESNATDWEVRDGAYQQTSRDGADLRAMAGDVKWTDGTLSVKARKIEGDEGFIVMFRAKDDAHWY